MCGQGKTSIWIRTWDLAWWLLISSLLDVKSHKWEVCEVSGKSSESSFHHICLFARPKLWHITCSSCCTSPYCSNLDPTFSFWSRVTWQSRYLSGCYLQSVINCGALERATCSVQHLTHSCWVNNVSRDWDTCLQPPPSALITNAPGSSLHLPSSFSHISNQTCTFCPCLETHTEIQTPRHTL